MRGCPIALALLALLRTAPVGAQDPVSAFTNVSVIPMDRERVLPDQTVLVRGSRIIALGPAGQIQVPAGAQQIDGRGKFLIPGLADMHAHLQGSAKESQDLWLFLANGVTTVRDMHSTRDGGANSTPLVLRAQVARGERLGPRIYTTADPSNTSAQAAAKSLEELRPLALDFVKVSIAGSDTSTLEVYDSIAAAARRLGLRLVGHVPVSLGLKGVLRDHDQWASIEHLMGYHDELVGAKDLASGLPSQDLESMVDTATWMRPSYRLPSAQLHELATATRQAGVWNCPTLAFLSLFEADVVAGRLDMSDNPALLSVMHRLNEFNLQITKALQDAGAGLLLGTDMGEGFGGSGLLAGFSIHDELAMLVKAGLTPYQALATGTRNVAEFLGTSDSTGAVAVGKRADLVLLSGNPLTDISYTGGPAGVMVGGRWLSRAELEAGLDSLPPDSKRDEVRGRVWRH